MTYQVILKRSAEKELDTLPREAFDKAARKLLTLEQNPRPFGVQKLHGHETYRLRLGDYRILYLIDDAAKRIDVISVAHRRKAYR